MVSNLLSENGMKNRVILYLESNFPGPFYSLKQQAIKLLVG